MRAVFDTNILVDYLNGFSEAADVIARYKAPFISRITWMEIIVGAKGDDELTATREFLRLFRIEELSEAIAEEAVRVRQAKRVRLPDAIVYATASSLGCQLVTRNTKDFDATDPHVRIPYSITQP
jgi:predicted nucleic acid-binding protein